MKNIFAVVVLSLVGSAAVSQSSSFSLSAVVRLGQSPSETIQVTVPAGSVATVDLSNDVRLEFATSARGADEQETVTRLLRHSGGDTEILHTTRQGGEMGVARSNAYLVCQDEVTFMSPAPELVPECGN